jgi:YD repeat-containing protein
MKKIKNKMDPVTRYYAKLDRISMCLDMPYFNQMVDWGRTKKEDQDYMIRKILGADIDIRDDRTIYDVKGNKIYAERSDALWISWEYDDNNNEIYMENSDNFYTKRKYDADGNMTFRQSSDDSWTSFKYDANGNMIYRRNADYSWTKWGYDANGNIVYKENSYDGLIIDYR